jgi:anti-sigma factor RsiW
MSDVIFLSVHDDLEAYVLGALDRADEQRFVDHLAECAECRAGAASYVPVMHALRTIPQAVAPRPPIDVPMVTARRITFNPFAYAAAAAFFLAAGGGIHFLMQPKTDNLLVQVAGMMADGPRQVALRGPGARGRALVGHHGLRTAFVVRGLTAPPSGEAYHVWVQGAATKFVGTLQPARDGLSVLLVNGNLLSGTRSITVDLESANAAAAPSGPTVATGTVQ